MNTHSRIIVEGAGYHEPSRHGIKLRVLPKMFRLFLETHHNLYRWANNYQVIECILKMNRPNTSKTDMKKIYWDWNNKTVVDRETLINNCNYTDWVCAISGKPIKAKFMNFDLKNFVHPEYWDVLDAPMIDSRILKSSIEFRKKCKELLLNERQEFLNASRKNSKRILK